MLRLDEETCSQKTVGLRSRPVSQHNPDCAKHGLIFGAELDKPLFLPKYTRDVMV